MYIIYYISRYTYTYTYTYRYKYRYTYKYSMISLRVLKGHLHVNQA